MNKLPYALFAALLFACVCERQDEVATKMDEAPGASYEELKASEQNEEEAETSGLIELQEEEGAEGEQNEEAGEQDEEEDEEEEEADEEDEEQDENEAGEGDEEEDENEEAEDTEEDDDEDEAEEDDYEMDEEGQPRRSRFFNRQVAPTNFVGCFRDRGRRDLPIFAGHHQRRQCMESCARKGAKFFGMQWNNQCFCSKGGKFGRYGRANSCKCLGKNKGGWVNCVYGVRDVETNPSKFFTGQDPPEDFMGCFRDAPKRDLAIFKGHAGKAHCRARCAKIGAQFYGIQWANQCFCAKGEEFGRYGQTDTCRCNGRNKGAWVNCVYACQ